MFYKYTIIIFSTLFSFHIEAQNINNLKGINSIESLPVVYGWYRDMKKDKWITQENEIKGIDKFKNYYILSFDLNSQKYIAIIKEKKEKNNSIFDIHVVDYYNYIDQISKWSEHDVIKLPIFKYYQAIIKKNELISMESLGLDNLSDLLINTRDHFVLQYKFFSDSTVKFILYREICSSDICLPVGIDIKEEYMPYLKYLEGDELYENFFYKTTIKYFTDFIDSPLK